MHPYPCPSSFRSWIGAAALAVALVHPVWAQDGKGGSERGAPAAIVVSSRLDRSVAIWINGEMRGRVQPGQEGRFDGIAPGSVNVRAGGGEAVGPVASETRTLSPGETFTWTLYPVLSWEEEKGTGTIVVVNGLDREAEVLLGGNPAGTLAPGATRAYPRIVSGSVAAAARAPGGETLGERTLELAPGGIVRWEIGKTDDGKP